MQWHNWVKTWAGAFWRFLGICIAVNWEKISMAAILHFLKLILIWLWNINETYFFIMNLQATWSLLPESVVQSLTLFFQMFPFDPPEHIGKPLVFWCLQGDQKETLGRKGLTTLYQFFTKIINRNVPRQNIINFLSVVSEKFLFNFQQYLLIHGINDN